jgi:hypothetical protein
MVSMLTMKNFGMLINLLFNGMGAHKAIVLRRQLPTQVVTLTMAILPITELRH